MLVVFDLDGTLIDSYRDIAAALNDTLRALDRPTHDPEVVKTMIGAGVGMLLERGLNGERALIERAKTIYRDAYAARLTETTKLYDGIEELLTQLETRGVSTAIATNKPSFFTNPLVEKLGLTRIKGVASSDEAGTRKPNPKVVHLAIERAGGDPEYVYVGDMPIDRETAAAVPCPFIGVAWGFDPKGLRCEHLAGSPRELVELLHRMEKKRSKK